MHFSTIPVSLALAVGMTAAAGPVVERDNVTSLKVVEVPEPKAGDVPTGGAPAPNGGSDEVVVTGDGGGPSQGAGTSTHPMSVPMLPLPFALAGAGGDTATATTSATTSSTSVTSPVTHSARLHQLPLGYGVYVGRHNRRYCNGMHFNYHL